MVEKILISGSTGLVGSAIRDHLDSSTKVFSLVRKQPVSKSEFYWKPSELEIDESCVEGIDAVIHLAGENVADGRWTAEKKAKILNSRINGTRIISQTIAKAKHPPKVLVSASAIGIYGSRGEEFLDETSSHGTDFLAKVCEKWEAETQSASEAGVRVVHVRIGIVLSKQGGALKKMLLPFKLGLGGVAGSGKQYMSWISLNDIARVFIHCINNQTISGAVNAVAPNPVTNYEFTKTLGKIIKRPTFFPLPEFMLKLIFGEMAQETVLASTRCVPEVLNQSSFSFEHSELSDALLCLST